MAIYNIFNSTEIIKFFCDELPQLADQCVNRDAEHQEHRHQGVDDRPAELVEEDVLIIEGDKLFQKRMVKDNEISEARSKAGKKGGETTQSKKEFAKAKSEANSEDEHENEDESIIVINKPVGLVVHPAVGHRDGTLQNALLYHDSSLAEVPRAGIVHRLDKDTSGLLVVARTLKVHKNLVDQLQARTVHREYQAIVLGVMTAGNSSPLNAGATSMLLMSKETAEKKGIKIADISKACGIPYATLHGGFNNPDSIRLCNLKKIADFLKISIDELYEMLQPAKLTVLSILLDQKRSKLKGSIYHFTRYVSPLRGPRTWHAGCSFQQ